MELDGEMSMDTDLIGKFITQQVAVTMAEKTKHYEKNIKKLVKGGRDRVSGESSSKNGTRGVGRASKKNKKPDPNEHQVKTTTEICISSGTRPKEHPSEPLEETIQKSRRCQQQYARKREKEKISALQKCINVDHA